MDKTPEEKAAQATVWMTRFTFVLAIVGILTLWILFNQLNEMHGGGIDTHTLAQQAVTQGGDTHELAVQAKNQADSTKELVDRMKDQADQTKIIATQASVQAKEAKVAADAATSAAQTQIDTLHISQRAYLVIGIPSIHTTIPHIEFPIDNIGHIVSGPVTIIVQGAVFTGISTTEQNTMNNGWGEIKMIVAPGSGKDSFNVPLPTFDINRANNGTQFIEVAGKLSYNDGFPGTPIQVVPFCYRSGAIVSIAPGGGTPTPATQMQLSKCDPDVIIPEMEQMDEHYDPKYKWPMPPE